MTKLRGVATVATIKERLAEHQDILSLVEPEIRQWANQYATGHLSHYASVMNEVNDINRCSPVSTVLDIGAVPGHISLLMALDGYLVHAVDLKPERAQSVFKAANIPFYKVNVEGEVLPFEENSFDLVLFCEILEHLRANPIHALREIRRVLKATGTVLLSTPNITPVMRWRFLFGEDFQDSLPAEFRKLETIGHMGHFRLYSKTEVIELLRHCGLQPYSLVTGGKLNKQPRGLDSWLMCRLRPQQMRAQLYVQARPTRVEHAQA